MTPLARFEMAVAAFYRIDFDYEIPDPLFTEVMQIIQEGYRKDSLANGMIVNGDLMKQVENEEWRKLHGPFRKV